MKIRGFLLMAGLVFSVSQTGLKAEAQQQAVSCALHKNTYLCDWAVFKKTLAAARTIALKSKPMDPGGDAELKKLAGDLGKRAVVAPEEDADLVMVIVPAEDSGIFYGPGGRALATLRVYGRGSLNRRGPLMWAETLDGQPDIPWPAVVYQLIAQFQSRVTGH